MVGIVVEVLSGCCCLVDVVVVVHHYCDNDHRYGHYGHDSLLHPITMIRNRDFRARF